MTEMFPSRERREESAEELERGREEEEKRGREKKKRERERERREEEKSPPSSYARTRACGREGKEKEEK